MPMTTRQSCKTSDVLIGQPPFREIRGQEIAPCQEGQPPTEIPAALKDCSFLFTVYHVYRQKATKTAPAGTDYGPKTDSEGLDKHRNSRYTKT